MTPVRRSLVAWALVAAPAFAVAQMAPVKPDGSLRYALGGGGSYVSGTTATAARAAVGGEGVVATFDNRWRFGGKALWSRTAAGETAAENLTLQLEEESQHRWNGKTWFRQKLSLFPALRAGETAHAIFDTGVAMAMSPFCNVSVGMTQRYEGGAGIRLDDTLFVTAIALKLR